MAFDPSPSTWLGAGYTLAANVVGMKTASAGSNVTLPLLTDADADPTTGDIREVARGFLDALSTAWDDTAEADRPTKMQLVKTTRYAADGTVSVTYSVTFNAAATIGAVSSES